MADQAGCLQRQNRSEVTHPNSSHARRCLIWLSCDNRVTVVGLLVVCRARSLCTDKDGLKEKLKKFY
ncbi:hypothetical protein J6590_035125 [Homalodisca vitripennis]|nr:hypothetical protein J6590_035125 [Homalodisca vitripennis]